MAQPALISITRLHLAENELLDFQYLRALAYQLYGGAAPGEVLQAAHEIARRGGKRTDFIEVWAGHGRRAACQAAAALERGRRATARAGYLRAYNYLRAAEFFFDRHNPQEHRALYLESLACFDQAARLFDVPAEPIEIPYEHGVSMPGYFLKPALDDTPRATVIISGGGDGFGEETYFIGGAPEALARGLNVLLFHGPGQRGLLHRHPDLVFRADAEVPIGSVIDHARSRPDVDPERLALYGLSFGGYLAPRAAVHDKRIKAVVANAPISNFYDLLVGIIIEKMPALIRPMVGRLIDHAPAHLWNMLMDRMRARDWVWDAMIDNYMLWNNGAATFAEFVEKTRQYTLEGCEAEIRCPTLCLVPEGESPAAMAQARRFYEALRAPKRFEVLSVADGADSHCGLSNIAHTASIVYDWIIDTFTA
jgi:dienelactone hydrolase